MKVSELSRRTGVPLPTIKFYIREGLLSAGERTGRNQAEYSEEHIERLVLVRALREDAGLGVAAIARVLSAADSAKPITDFVQHAIDAVERPAGPAIDEGSKEFVRALERVLAESKRQGWGLDETSTSVRDAARALTVIGRSFPVPEHEESLRPYGDAATLISKHEIPDDWQPAEAPSAALRYAVLGTVLYEPLILALRRMANLGRARAVVAGRTTPKPRPERTARAAGKAKKPPR